MLWRYPPRRIEAEPLRDAMLFVSSKLDLRMGGPGFDLFEPNGNYVEGIHAEEGIRPGRVPSDDLPEQAAHAARRHVRRVRLSGRRADCPKAKHLHNCRSSRSICSIAALCFNRLDFWRSRIEKGSGAGIGSSSETGVPVGVSEASRPGEGIGGCGEVGPRAWPDRPLPGIV